MNRIITAVIIAITCIAAGSLSGCAADPPETEPRCPYGDTSYPLGTSFEDGCTDCICNQNGSVSCTAASADDQDACFDCTHDQAGYMLGQMWPAGDGCNYCQCLADGEVACSETQCAPTCNHQGFAYQLGESFTASDGCNTCTCQADGSVSCTDMACD